MSEKDQKRNTERKNVKIRLKRAKVQGRVADLESVLPLVNLVCSQVQRILLQPLASSSHWFSSAARTDETHAALVITWEDVG